MNEYSYKVKTTSLAKQNRKLKKMLWLSWVYILVTHVLAMIIYFI